MPRRPCCLPRPTSLLRRIPWRSPLFRHMCWIYAATFLIVLPLLCHNLLHSLFFIKNNFTKEALKSEMQRLNDERIDQAEAFLSQANHTHQKLLPLEVPDTKALDLVISVVTVSRNRHQEGSYKPKYLTQVVARLVTLMQEATARGFPYSMHLEICNVDSDPASYQEAKFLSAFVPMIQRFNKTNLPIDDRLEKEKKDYVFCLEQSQRLNPRYTLIIEDDALPDPAFFTGLQQTLHSHLDQQYLRGEFHNATDHVAFVKLYHPERLLGYVSYEVERIPELIALSLILATIATLLYNQLLNPAAPLRTVQLLFVIYFLLALLVIDRSNINEFRRVFAPYFFSYVPAPECCTPAMLFPKPGAETIIKFLNGITCKKNFGKDTAIWRFIVESRDPRWRAFMVQPNLVSHIGMHSALRNQLVDPFIV